MSENKSTTKQRSKRESNPGAPGAVSGTIQVTAVGETESVSMDLAPTASTEVVATTPAPAQLAVVPSAPAALVAAPAPVEDEFGGVGEGLEGSHPSDNVMPAVAIMQGQSPEVKESGGKIKDGDFLIKSTGQHFDGKKGFLFVVCGLKRAFNHWNNRNDEKGQGNGKGFIREFDGEDPLVIKLTGGNKVFGPVPVDTTPGKATSLVETKTLFGLIIDEDTGQYQLATIPCSSSKIKAYNNATTTIRTFRLKGRTLNAYNFIWRVTTQQVKQKGTSNYYADLRLDPAFEPFAAPDSKSLLTMNSDRTIFEVARQLTQDIKAQRVKAETHVVEDTSDDDDGGGAPKYAGQPVNADDAPF